MEVPPILTPHRMAPVEGSESSRLEAPERLLLGLFCVCWTWTETGHMGRPKRKPGSGRSKSELFARHSKQRRRTYEMTSVVCWGWTETEGWRDGPQRINCPSGNTNTVKCTDYHDFILSQYWWIDAASLRVPIYLPRTVFYYSGTRDTRKEPNKTRVCGVAICWFVFWMDGNRKPMAFTQNSVAHANYPVQYYPFDGMHRIESNRIEIADERNRTEHEIILHGFFSDRERHTRDLTALSAIDSHNFTN